MAPGTTRRGFLEGALAGLPLLPAVGSAAGGARPAALRRDARLEVSVRERSPAGPGSGPEGPVRPDEFGMVGVYDVDWLLDPRFGRLLDNMAASPGAFTAVRFFGALSGGVREHTEPTSGGTVWPEVGDPMDFSVTLSALEALTTRGLTPFVVLSFFPPAVSASPTVPPDSFEAWKRLVRGFLDALAADPRFGRAAIRRWWFEVWNEPNIPVFWKGDFSKYLDLYRATSEAVAESGHEVRLGGPALAYLPTPGPDAGTPLMERFLRAMRDEPRLKCDFISLHRKGVSAPVDREPDVERPISAAEETARMALAIDPGRFRGVPIVNNEADMKVGFDSPYEPRMDETFPAWMAGLMVAYDDLSSRHRADGMRFVPASDNANQHLVRGPFDGRRSIMTQASASGRDLFKLPVYNFYECLRLLGTRHGTVVAGGELCYPNSELFQVVTVADTHVAALVCAGPRPGGTPGGRWALDYAIRDVPWARVNVAQFRIDARRSNAYTAAGRRLSIPVPGAALARNVRLAQELAVASPIRRDVRLADGVFRDQVDLEPSTVVLYWITPFVPPAAGRRAPGPAWLEAALEDGNVVLRWTPSREPSFYSYELVRLNEGSGAGGARLSPDPLRAAMWVDTAPPSGSHVYGVRALDASGGETDLALTGPVRL